MCGLKVKDDSNQQEKIKSPIQGYNHLIEVDKSEYQGLLSENLLLKQIISNHFNEKFDNGKKISSSEFKGHIHHDYGFYMKIILAIAVIILSLAFHIVYLSVASCLFYTNGSSQCWIKSWLGIPVYASFFIDLTLYLLIGCQLVLIILILKTKIKAISNNK
ncbi:MAG: hypothetical protein EU532_01050 [Promethearchaeota archaeon]|nr:MAG: hypothetical protein EU532_01050 [Candidatus Lokiarchaeota archaeon]